MIKSTVGIGTIIHNPEVPAWARNYLDKNNLDIFYDVKVTKRKQAIARLLKEMGKEEILEELEFNSKGQAFSNGPRIKRKHFSF